MKVDLEQMVTVEGSEVWIRNYSGHLVRMIDDGEGASAECSAKIIRDAIASWLPPPAEERRIIDTIAGPGYFYVVMSDNTIFQLKSNGSGWVEMAALPPSRPAERAYSREDMATIFSMGQQSPGDDFQECMRAIGLEQGVVS